MTPSFPARRSASLGVVVRSVDGDTLVVDVGGSREDVRLIGIDTPESVARDRPVECFGPEAKEHMAELLPAGTAVRLERDVEARDRYGRLLRSEEHTSELQSLMRISYAVFCLKKKTAEERTTPNGVNDTGTVERTT